MATESDHADNEYDKVSMDGDMEKILRDPYLADLLAISAAQLDAGDFANVTLESLLARGRARRRRQSGTP